MAKKYLTQAQKLEAILKYGSFRLVPKEEVERHYIEHVKCAEKHLWPTPERPNLDIPTYEFKPFKEHEESMGMDCIWQRTTNPFSLVDLIVHNSL
ncbi:MAG: hypothetical protein ABJH04_08015 [Cyclobacteriaceae bacterium]